MSKKTLSELFRRWSKPSRGVPVDGAARNRARLRLEEVEQRVVPATLPPVTASDTRVLTAGFAPQAVADPTNPNTIVVVSANGAALNGQITRDGGQTWTNFAIANPDAGAFAGIGLTTVGTPSVTMSRTGDLYVVWTTTSADLATAGRLRVASFTVQQTTPFTGSGVSVLNPSVMLYQWINQDPVYNPVVAVDNLLDEFTDPETQATTLQDTMQRANGSGKAVYVAWNTNGVVPTVAGNYQPFTGVFTPTAIFAASSRDRGATWTTPVTVNTNGYYSGSGGVAPQIRFTPGDLNSNTVDTSGRLQFFWQSPGGQAMMDITTPDDDGDPTTPNIDVEVTTNYASPIGPGGPIAEAGLDPNSGPDFPATTTSKITVAIDNSDTSTNGAFFNQLSDIDVTVALAHPHLNQLRVDLLPPNGLPPINLVMNRIDSSGNQIPTGGVPQGLPDNNDTSGNSGLGVVNLGPGRIQPGTVFSAEGPRLIFDPVNVAAPRSATSGYIAHYRPESGGGFSSVSSLYGRDATELSGVWTLRITDFRDDDRQAGPVAGNPELRFWSMQMSSLIRQNFGADRFLTPAGAGGAANLGGTGATAATAPAGAAGFNAGFSYAYDLSQGSFSPYSGRLYTAYASAAGNIISRYSDDQGLTWSTAVQINDDSASDNYSEGARSQFQPTITVDPVTGTVVAMWYDARWDASNTRVSTFMATSLDGGETWSVQDKSAFLNNPKNATDQLNRDTVVLEPVPTNLRAIGAQEAGQRQSLIAYGGQVKPFWTGNENAGGGSVYTATIQTSAGPRVVDNDLTLNTDQGAVTVGAAGGYNNTFTADGTRRIDGFTISFDRLVNVSTFDVSDVTVLYRAPGTDRTVAATRIPVSAIVALDPVTPQSGFPDDATRFFVRFATPQSAAGTYSYSVGPNVSDRIRTPRVAIFTPPDTPTALPDLRMVESTISVPELISLPVGSPAPVVANMEVKLDISHTHVGDLRITLFGPDPDGPGPLSAPSVVLSNRRGGSGSFSGIRFNDSAITPIANFPAGPGIYRAETPLAAFNGQPMAGNWTLRVEDLDGSDSGTLRGWTLTFLDAGGAPVTSIMQAATFMDQDGDARTREIGTNFDNTLPASQQAPKLYTDAYTAPGSSGRDQFNIDPFAAPVANNTLPLISTGPHLVLVGNPGETAVVSFATRSASNPLILNVTLDRAVDITTFDISDVLSVVNQAGPVAATLVNVVPTNAANEIASKFDFVFSGPNLPTGKYSVSLGTNFLVADGMFRNVESNQMLVRFDRDIDPASFTSQNVLRITGPIGDIQDVQDITVLGTAGTFTVTFSDATGSQTTPALPYNIPASGGISANSSLQNAIAALTKVGAGNVVVTAENLVGGGRVFHVVFTGLLRSTQLPMSAIGTGGTTVSVNQVGITVTPVPTTVNAVTGGARAFFVTYPKQNISGPYTIEFGQNPQGGSIRAVDVPQLVSVVSTPTTTLDVTFLGAQDEVQRAVVSGTAGTFTLTFNGQTTAPLAFNATALQVRSALEALPGIGSGNVQVALSSAAGTNTYTITFTGGLAKTDVAQLVAVGAGGASASVTTTTNGRSDSAVAADLIRLTGPSGNVSLAGVTAARIGTSSTFRFTFPTALTPGQYVLDFNPAFRVANTGPAMDMNFNAGLDTLRGDDPASNDLDPLSYASTGAVAIPPAPTALDPTLTESFIVVDQDYIIRQSTLEQIRVLLNISHPDVRGLTIDLVPPDSTGVGPIRLFTGSLATRLNSTNSANFENTLLVDRVGDPNVTNIEAGAAPFRSGGSFYSPQTPLSALVGKSSKGVWTLRVQNDGTNTQTSDPNFVTGDPIQITNWGLTLPRALTIESQRFDRTSGVPIDPTTVTVTTTRAGSATVSEIQTIAVIGTTGTFTISFNGATTGSLARTATALQIQNALNGLSTIGGVGGSVSVSSVVNGNNQTFTVTFSGALANRDVPQMTTSATPVITNSSITIPVDFVITETTLNQIRMLVNIAHPNVRDLDIDLIGPDGTTVRLFTGTQLAPTASNQSANFTNTRFSNRVGDPSTPSIQSAIPPFNAGEAGFFSPQNSLDPFIGKHTLGTWTLRVTNRGTNAATTDPNFNPNAPIQIVNWNITFPKQVVTTGLGQANADRFQAAFRVFTQDPTNTLTQTTWTPVGPAPTNETNNAARISAMAVDPTDPTGNTVYVAVAGGGIWKTTDFLNSSSALQNGGLVPRGPSYVPLTDFGPTSAVNISSIALFPRNNDPHQTIVFALTGEPSTLGKMPGSLTSAGVGVIRSLDGGRSWQVLDSTRNVDAAGNIVLMSDQNTRDHLFVGATGYKIVVDPKPGRDGGVIVYMALSGNANQNGLWRSLNGGNTWTRVMAGNATDVVLAAGSANVTDPASGKTVFEGNLQQLYAGFRNTPAGGPGVYKTDSAPAALSLDFMAGGTTNPLIIDTSITGSPSVTTNNPVSIPNSGNRITLATPALTGDPLKDSFLKDWVYAMTDDAAGNAQLYMTKDAGAHWTRVRIPNLPNANVRPDFPVQGTNDESGARLQTDVETVSDYNMALAVDPENPYIVYMAGFGNNSIRLDLTTMRDAHNFTFYDNSDPGFVGAGGVQTSTVGGLQPRTAGARGAVRIGGSNTNYLDSNGVRIGFLNLFGGRDYNQPFITNSVVRVRDTGDEPTTLLAGSFVNDGSDISWSPFEEIFQTEVPGQTGSARTQNRFDGANTHAIVSFTDPVTGKTRLIFGTDDGVFTGVDSASTIGVGTLTDGIGFSSAVKGNRNGNLQVSQFWSGAVQPSQLAADLAGALFYGMGDQSGFPVSSPNILASGDLNWRGPTGDGVSVLVDQAGSGTAFQYRSPLSSGFDLNATALEEDFFRVLSNTSDHAFGGGFSRTGNSTGSLFDQPGEFWRNNTASIITNNPLISQPNANPANPNILIFGSATGRVYRSTDQGVSWAVKAQPGNLDGTPVLSVAFGASDPALPTLVNNFMYAGTNGGRIYSTTTGGTPWTLIGSAANGLNGAAVIRVVPNPQVGTKDVFALTTSGVFYKADGTTAAGNWVNITGNLFNLTRTVFGNPADLDPALRANSLTALAVDWRYAFPQPLNPSQTFPVLYAAGDGGVFRTMDFGTTWTFFPDVATDGAAADGGYLPNTHITDLDLSIGNLDPNTGRYQSGGFNMLVATTYGRGTFAIRLDPNIPASSFVSGPRVTQLINPNPVNGPSAQLQVRFSSAVDPATFTPADVQIIGPGGTPITITSVNMISVPDANGVNPRNLFAITFPTQAGLGSYDITIGYNPTGNDVPLISDPSGFLMNQDNDTVNGESIVDQYRSTIVLNANTNNRLVVTSSPSSAVAGSAYSVTIQARDANDLLLGNVNGTLTLTPAPGTGTFTPNTVNIVNGVAIFDVTYQTAGDQTINVAFNSLPAINGTAWTTTVVAGAATQFSIAPANSTVTASNTPLSFTVTAQDAFGNTAKTYNQTATLSRAGAAATIPASVLLTNGVGTFNGTFPTTGNVQITATGPDLVNPPSGTITGTANVSVVPGTATQLGISISAGPYTIGSTATVTVRALDALGNVANNLNGTTISTSVTPIGQSIVNPTNPVFVNGVATYTITFQAAGTFTITNTANGPITGTISVPVTAAPPPPSPTDNLPAIYAVGSGVNGSQYATIYNGDGSVRSTIEPFPPGFNQQVDPSGRGFLGGIRVAVGDVTGDGVPDYVMGSGPTIQASVAVFNGANGKRILDYKPFETFTGGVFVTTGDITGDGIDEIIMTPDEGGGPRVTVLRGGDFSRIFNFFGIRDESFRGGARPAVGDLNGDGFGELIVAAGFGGGPRISIYDGAFLAQGKFNNPIGDFFIFEESLRNGAYIAVGDVNGDGFGDLVAGAGPGGGPRVMVVSGKKLLEAGPDGPYPALAAPIANYFSGDPNARGGVRVTTKNIDGDRNSEVVTGSGGTDEFGNLGGSRVSVYLGKNLTVQDYLPLDEFDYITGFYNGVFVG